MWSSRVVAVRKKDGTIRCCVDYRALNSITISDQYPLPTFEEIVANLNKQKYYSSIDLNQGYLQMRGKEEDREKTAFVEQSGLYQFNRMPFGLKNAPPTFQRLMDKVLAGLKYNSCFVYLDDIMVFGSSLDEHNRNLKAVIQRLTEAGLTIKQSKCAFGVKELRFLGHLVNEHGWRMDPNKITALMEKSRPRDVAEVQSFIGLASSYRKFLQNFAKVAEPLTRLTRQNEEFRWDK